MAKRIDLSNQQINNLLVLEPADNKNGKTYWKCKCLKCEKIVEIQTSHLRGKNAQQTCGHCNEKTIIDYSSKKRICQICNKEFTILNDKAVTRKYCYECNPQQGTLYNSKDRKIFKQNLIQYYKQKAVDYKGGKCEKCGYSKCLRALHFHHLNPDDKSFQISEAITKNLIPWDLIQEELDKCILLCANCHAEEHDK